MRDGSGSVGVNGCSSLFVAVLVDPSVMGMVAEDESIEFVPPTSGSDDDVDDSAGPVDDVAGSMEGSDVEENAGEAVSVTITSGAVEVVSGIIVESPPPVESNDESGTFAMPVDDEDESELESTGVTTGGTSSLESSTPVEPSSPPPPPPPSSTMTATGGPVDDDTNDSV